MTSADLIPGTMLLPRDTEQPRVVIIGRAPRGGIRCTVGDTVWHWHVDGLVRALVLSGYEVAA